MRTIRPLDTGKRIFSVGARGSYADLGKLNAKSDDMGYRANAMYVDQFADDTIGIALGASYNNEPYQIKEYNAWGYSDLANGDRVIGGAKAMVTSTKLKRMGLNGTLQWKPAPNLTTTLDAFYSNFKDDQIKRGVEMPLQMGVSADNPAMSPVLTATTVENGLVTSGQFANAKPLARNDLFQRHAKLYSFGWNTKWEGDDGWNAFFDASYSKTDRSELTIETTAGTGRNLVGAKDNHRFQYRHQGLDLLERDRLRRLRHDPPHQAPRAGAAPRSRRMAPRSATARTVTTTTATSRTNSGSSAPRSSTSSKAARCTRSRSALNYTNRSKSLVPEEYFLGLAANTDGPHQRRRASGISARRHRSEHVRPRLGDQLRSRRAGARDGIYNRVANPYGDVVVKSYAIRERLMTAYFQGNIDSEVGSAHLTGNFGVQAQWTDQNSLGATAVNLGTAPNGSPIIGGQEAPCQHRLSRRAAQPQPLAALPERHGHRFAAAREIIRPASRRHARLAQLELHDRGRRGAGHRFLGNPNPASVARQCARLHDRAVLRRQGRDRGAVLLEGPEELHLQHRPHRAHRRPCAAGPGPGHSGCRIPRSSTFRSTARAARSTASRSPPPCPSKPSSPRWMASGSPARSPIPRARSRRRRTRPRVTSRAIRSGSPTAPAYFEKWGFNARGFGPLPFDIPG
ncbi:hypothetical protein [Novosphingobium resinovorum]|uniref:hypothetical protein n=1 Tax=Novosphingobium resinovorum TaxID=158500 RepID=UPI003D2A238D